MFWLIALLLTVVYYIVLIKIDKKRQAAYQIEQRAIPKIKIDASFLSTPETISNTEPKIEQQATTQIEPKTEKEIQEENKTEVQTAIQPTIQSEPKIEQQATTQIESKAEKEIQEENKTEVQTTIQPTIQSEPKIEQQATTQIESKAEKEIQAENKTEVQTTIQSEPKIEQQATTKIEPKTEKEIEPPSNTLIEETKPVRLGVIILPKEQAKEIQSDKSKIEEVIPEEIEATKSEVAKNDAEELADETTIESNDYLGYELLEYQTQFSRQQIIDKIEPYKNQLTLTELDIKNIVTSPLLDEEE